MKIAVYGAGGIGAYFGGRLALAGSEVHLLARGAHLRALQERGLRAKSDKGDFACRLPATDRPKDIGRCDYVLFSVKSFDTADAASQLQPLLRDGTAVISLQNGVDNEERIAAAIGTPHIMGGASFIFSIISEPGVIHQIGETTRFVFGEMDGRRTERAERFRSQCLEAGIDAEISPSIQTVLWSKFVFICFVAGMTAVTRLPLGDLRQTSASWEMGKRVMQEIMALAAADGIDLPPDTIDSHLRFAESLPPESYSSLHYDLTHGKPMELEALHGTAVRLGRQHGISVPMCEAIYSLLEPWAKRNRRSD
jgi:2-dehydropantoate 2-reductase